MPISGAGTRAFSARGFSLIELLVVLTITTAATLAIAGALPQFRPVSAIESSATEIATTMRRARTLAIMRADTVTVWLDRRSRRFWIGGDAETHFVPASLEIGWPDRREDLGVRFFADGTANHPGLSLSDGYKRIELSISPLTGRVALRK